MSKESRAARCGGQSNVTQVLSKLNATLPCRESYPYNNTPIAKTVQRMVNQKLIGFDKVFGRWLRLS